MYAGELCLAGSDGAVVIVDGVTFEEKHSLQAHTGACVSVDISSNGRCARVQKEQRERERVLPYDVYLQQQHALSLHSLPHTLSCCPLH